jgi:hypothetical protein
LFLSLRRATRVADLQEGEERIVEGRVVGRRELTVPGTQLKCVWFYQLSESFEVGARGRGRKMWVPKNVQQKSEGFFIDDGTGRVWVAANEDGTEVSGGVEEAGMLGKKGKARYIARMIRGGDVVRVRGMVCGPKGAEPGDVQVLRPGRKGRLEILFRKAVD